ncbi:MAG: serine hydrolase [Verrucomicrobiales bacterium]|nr:serine hydrolase [Verrucomicrobiales bacterium]
MMIDTTVRRFFFLICLWVSVASSPAGAQIKIKNSVPVKKAPIDLPASPRPASLPPVLIDDAPDPQREKKNMLERIADNLSARTQAVLKREKALAEREKALSDREQALLERETIIESRENLIKRREKLPPPHAWNGPKTPSVKGKYVAIIDGKTGQFYHLKNADKKTPVASTQKLLTALIVIRNGDLDKKVLVTPEIAKVEPTVIGIKPGQHYTRRELLKGLLVRSGNDIAECLAIDQAGSVEAFSEQMNAYALLLGMSNSHFTNPHGLPDKRQYSTAHDMALLAFEAYQEPVIRDMVKIKSCDFHFSDGKKRTLINTNRVLRSYPLCNGMKTGYTRASGKCLISSAHKDGQDRIVIIIGSSSATIWKSSHSLLEWALNLEIQS